MNCLSGYSSVMQKMMLRNLIVILNLKIYNCCIIFAMLVFAKILGVVRNLAMNWTENLESTSNDANEHGKVASFSFRRQCLQAAIGSECYWKPNDPC
jgi:hypothetical protein